MSLTDLHEQVLRTWADNWQRVAQAWDPCCSVVDDYHEQLYPGKIGERCWSCFFVGDLLRDLLGMPRDLHNEQQVFDAHQVDAILQQRDVAHTFSVMNHMFTIVRYRDRKDRQRTYYCDYWMEARETNCFRAEQVTKRHMRNLLRSYLSEQSETFARFSSHDLAFVREYHADYYQHKDQSYADIVCGMYYWSTPIQPHHWLNAQWQLDRCLGTIPRLACVVADEYRPDTLADRFPHLADCAHHTNHANPADRADSGGSENDSSQG